MRAIATLGGTVSSPAVGSFRALTWPDPNGARSYDDYCGNPFAGMDKRTIRARLRNGTALLFERKNE